MSSSSCPLTEPWFLAASLTGTVPLLFGTRSGDDHPPRTVDGCPAAPALHSAPSPSTGWVGSANVRQGWQESRHGIGRAAGDWARNWSKAWITSWPAATCRQSQCSKAARATSPHTAHSATEYGCATRVRGTSGTATDPPLRGACWCWGPMPGQRRDRRRRAQQVRLR